MTRSNDIIDNRLLADYRGSVMAVVNDSTGFVETRNYYPYGLPHELPKVDKRAFEGKEMVTAARLHWLDYGPRRYDPATTFWTSPDPLSSLRPDVSPYAYCAANPAANIDPTGRKIQIVNINDQQLFLMIFRKEDKNFVTFDSNGFIDEATIAGHTSDSWLYNSTIAMVKDNEIIELEVGDVYYYSDNSGAIHYKKLGDIDYDGDLVTKCFLVSTKDSVLYYLNDHLWAFRKYEGYNGNYDLELHWNSDSIRHQLDETMNIFDGSWYTFARFIVKNGQIISIDTLSGIIDSDIPDKTAIQLFF